MLTLLVTGLLGAYFYQKTHLRNRKWFLFLAFKVYLAVFLGLIQVPYVYLYLTSLLYSAMVLALLPCPKDS